MHNTDTITFKLLNILFVVFSLYFLHTCYSLDADVSAIDFSRFIGILISYKITTALAAFLIFKIIYMGELTVVVLSAFVLNIFYKVFTLFLAEYDKIILLMAVIFLLVSYNMILLLREELAQAIFKPCFDKENFNFDGYCALEGNVYLSSGSCLPVKISNCDDKGIVIFTHEKISKGEKQPLAPNEGGFKLQDRENKLPEALKDLTKKIGGKLVKMQFFDLMKISAPIKIAYPKTYLEIFLSDYTYFPKYMAKVCKSKDHVERVKNITTCILAGLHVGMCVLQALSPLNPVLGET